MRETAWITATCVCLLGGTTAALAGLYNTAEAPVRPSPIIQEFRDRWMDLRSISVSQPESLLRRRYLLIAGLEPKSRTADLATEPRLNLSEYLIRIGKPQEAIQLLMPAAARERANFLLLSNLATAYQLAEQPERALSHLEQALAAWPKKWADLTPTQLAACNRLGWDEAQLQWYRQAEAYQLKLVRLRAREGIRQPRGFGKTPETVDALFDLDGQSLRFVGDTGQYQAGKLARAELGKLPKDAVQTVQQLLIWLPNDHRLYWLLGELLNAQGEIDVAARIFDELVGTNYQTLELREHRRILLEAKASAQAPAVQEESEPPIVSSPPGNSYWLPNPWQTLAVGFAAGLLVAFLGYWQVREFRRGGTK